MFGMLRKLGFSVNQPTDCSRWKSNAEFDPEWEERISRMASHIDGPGRVADFGCGMMWLEKHLEERQRYVPIDYIRRDHRTQVIDLNISPIPSIDADVAVFSGVLEYVADLQTLYQEIFPRTFRRIVLSYCTTEKYPDLKARAALGWRSHASIFDLLALFTKHYDLVAVDDIRNNTILVFDRKRP